MAIPADALQAIAFLCEERTIKHKKLRVPIATVFIVAVPEGDSEFLYAVTARHCLEDGRGNLFLRVNKKGSGFHDIKADRDDWTPHQDADVTATPFAPDSSQYPDLEYRTIPLWCFVGSGPNYAYTGPPLSKPHSLQPTIGHDVYFLGLFTQHWGVERNLPIARFGHISRMPDKLKLPRDRGTSSFETVAYLIESHSWGGHSGSPVFFMYPMTAQKTVPTDGGNTTMVIIGNCVGLLGLVSAHYTIPIEAEVTGDVLGKIETKLNSGIMVVTPADAVRQLLLECEDFVEDRKRRQKESDDNKPMPSMDTVATDEPASSFTKADFEQALKKASRKIEPQSTGKK